MFPGETAKKRRGFPSFLKSRKSPCQSGCGTIAMRYPAASIERPITAGPKEGWSMYASPVKRIISNSSQPRKVHSFFVVGRKSVSKYLFSKTILSKFEL